MDHAKSETRHSNAPTWRVTAKSPKTCFWWTTRNSPINMTIPRFLPAEGSPGTASQPADRRCRPVFDIVTPHGIEIFRALHTHKTGLRVSIFMEFLFCWPVFCAGGVGAGPGKPPAMRTATAGHFLAYQPRMALTFRARRKHAKRGHRGLHNEKSRPCPALCGGRLRWVMWRSPVALRRHSDLPS